MDDIELRVIPATAAYAAFLEMIDHRRRLEPDWAWAEVAAGVGLVLSIAAFHARQRPPISGREHERLIWRAFLASGTVIALWQLWQARARLLKVLEYHSEKQAQEMATGSGRVPQARRAGVGGWHRARAQRAGERARESYPCRCAAGGHRLSPRPNQSLDDRGEDRPRVGGGAA